MTRAPTACAEGHLGGSHGAASVADTRPLPSGSASDGAAGARGWGWGAGGSSSRPAGPLDLHEEPHRRGGSSCRPRSETSDTHSQHPAHRPKLKLQHFISGARSQRPLPPGDFLWAAPRRNTGVSAATAVGRGGTRCCSQPEHRPQSESRSLESPAQKGTECNDSGVPRCLNLVFTRERRLDTRRGVTDPSNEDPKASRKSEIIFGIF